MEEPPTGTLRLLQLAALTSTVDRFALAPLLVVIGLDLGEPLVAVAAVAGVFYLAYGLMQPVWSVISDRIGRVRTMRTALVGAAVGGLGSVVAPNLVTLGVFRALAGASVAALIPTTLVYVGDAWPALVRQRPLSQVLAASSLGTAVATAGAGVLADVLSWRVVPAITGTAAVLLWFALRRLPEPAGLVRAQPGLLVPLRSLREVLSTRWALLVLALVFVEGIVVLGVLTYLPPAVQELGTSATVAGVVAAAYGVSAFVFAQVVSRLVGRLSPAALAGIGGAFLAAAWAIPAVAVTVTTVAVAGLLAGVSWAFLHSTLQAWVTEVVPGQRATAVALFAALLFLGSAAGTALFAPAADTAAFGVVFLAATCTAVPLAVTAFVARRRYANRVAR